ncbi:MAG TPA: acetylornithine transaminase [Mycobacteriales bacterium]|jgi:acetylornithine aminotransferase|nr:acetylornithine transaminase [Mycobacteriales bacterium]
MTATTDLQQRWDAVMMPNYGTPPIALVSGEGCRVTDVDGREYLDLVAGIAVSSLGHDHPAIVAAVSEQVRRIAHTSNLVVNPLAVSLAERLIGICGLPEARVFLCNDGGTANEAAIKVALRARPGRRRFVAAERSFHGRSLGALALTGKAAVREPFAPFGIDVDFVPYDDPAALNDAVDERTAAVFLEPALGEAGVVPSSPGYLAAARQACDAVGALLVIDEVQGGVGRTGRWLAHQHEQVVPDVITLAKGLGGGLPIGACLAGGPAATALRPGDHGTTFGGNPVSCAAALAVLDTIETTGLLDHVARLGERWSQDLAAVNAPGLAGVRGQGLWLALLLDGDLAPAVQTSAREHGFLVNAIGADVVRLVPPLVLTDAEADSFTAALPDILGAAASATRLAS